MSLKCYFVKTFQCANLMLMSYTTHSLLLLLQTYKKLKEFYRDTTLLKATLNHIQGDYNSVVHVYIMLEYYQCNVTVSIQTAHSSVHIHIVRYHR